MSDSFATPWTVVCQARLLRPWDSPGKNTRVGCHFLLQGLFPTQGSNLSLHHCLADSLPLSHLGSPTWLPGSIKLRQWLPFEIDWMAAPSFNPPAFLLLKLIQPAPTPGPLHSPCSLPGTLSPTPFPDFQYFLT